MLLQKWSGPADRSPYKLSNSIHSESLYSTRGKANKCKCEIRSWQALWRLDQRKRTKKWQGQGWERGDVLFWLIAPGRQLKWKLHSSRDLSEVRELAMRWPGTLFLQKTEFKGQAGKPFRPGAEWEKWQMGEDQVEKIGSFVGVLRLMEVLGFGSLWSCLYISLFVMENF